MTTRVMPAAMAKAKDADVRAFIERCIGKPRARPFASELPNGSFFYGLDDDVSTPLPLSPSPPPPKICSQPLVPAAGNSCLHLSYAVSRSVDSITGAS
ncbi:hypothetical protein Cni_G12660 [Canna indica]|uniref:Uncharacterized protein n=1 Tax=Canna indica TaxID=4628 RepID=A0AAQ3K8R1_9LILI|nr:hypothetical protein Cni_G12660 [Canna indica]